MPHKNIKVIIKRQLKKDHPDWRRLTKKGKKSPSKQGTEAVVNDYDFKQDIETPVAELIGIDNQTIHDDVMTLDEINTMIDDFYKTPLIDVGKVKKYHVNLKNPQLKFIDNLLDNCLINRLFYDPGFTPSMIKLLPSDFLRAELLKAIISMVELTAIL